MSSKQAKGVGRKAAAGVAWTLLGEVLANVIRIGGVAALGRLLTREDFGVIAAAMTVVLFAQRFKEIGLGLALVQRKDISDEHVATTWGFSLLLGLALSIAVFLAAGPLADAYAIPTAADPLRALAALFIIRALSATSKALLQRELRFRAIATVNVAGYAAGTGTSITLAALGFGMWSLVIGYLVEAALDTILLLVARPPRVRPRIDKQPLRELIGFGSGHTLAAFANYFATQGDNIVVGRYLGAGMLGIYDRAYVLMRFPATVFTTVAGSVLFSAFARLQDDPQRLGVAYRRVLFACAIILLPAAAGLIVLAPEIIAILLGPDWDSVILPFQILAGSMLFRTTYKVSGIVARSAGAVLRIALYQVAYGAAVIGGAVLVIGDHGIAGVAVTTSIAVAFHFTNLSRLALAQVDLGWGTLVAAHRDGLVMAALAAAGAWPVAHFMRDVTGIAPTVIAATIAGALPALAFAAIRIRARAEDWLWLVDRVRSAGRKKTKKSVGEAPVDADV